MDQLFCFQFAVTRTDGTPYLGHYNRQLNVKVTHVGQGTSTAPEEKLIIPDDNIVKLDVMPQPGDTQIKITVSLCFIKLISMDTMNIFQNYNKL